VKVPSDPSVVLVLATLSFRGALLFRRESPALFLAKTLAVRLIFGTHTTVVHRWEDSREGKVL